ncbi:MAG: uracil phosphoribosyltransferase [Elusimicrobiota bacterium]
MPKRVRICGHPLMAECLAELRDKRTRPARFRALMEDAGVYLGITALQPLRTAKKKIVTPLRTGYFRRVDEPVVLIAVLRAGLGFVPGLSRLLPEAPVGFVGLYRDEETLNPVRYYLNLPKKLRRSRVLLLDPMLATGGSASESIRLIKEQGAKKVCLVTLLSTKPGIRRIQRDHPDTSLVTAAVDPVLNKIGFIEPGLGDAGDRLFGN